ncbi:MAG: hypothetical protein IID37_13180 [Planctomycetes bacterium]|nr:hypothetical protein [Planctomycetota bacterium]
MVAGIDAILSSRRVGAIGLCLCALGPSIGCLAIPDGGQIPDTGTGGDGILDSGGVPSLGTITAASRVCEADGLAGADCYVATVSCTGVPDAGVAIKHLSGTGDTIGTIILTAGGGGQKYYEDSTFYTFGPNLVEDLRDAGFATVQVRWEDGWNLGPGGWERVGCRYATVAQWVYDELHRGGGSAPFCATGNSGGASQIAYAMTRYGLDELFDIVVPSGGPPAGRIDLGCACSPSQATVEVPCGNDSLCYDDLAIGAMDSAYDGTPCADLESEILAADSVVADDADLHYPFTKVIAVFGDADPTSAVPQGMQWYDAITSEVEIICVPETQHRVASAMAGYETLRDVLITECTRAPE